MFIEKSNVSPDRQKVNVFKILLPPFQIIYHRFGQILVYIHMYLYYLKRTKVFRFSPPKHSVGLFLSIVPPSVFPSSVHRQAENHARKLLVQLVYPSLSIPLFTRSLLSLSPETTPPALPLGSPSPSSPLHARQAIAWTPSTPPSCGSARSAHTRRR
jgi:hypothetical protein